MTSWYVYSASSAVAGVPSDHFMPGRILKVQVFPSVDDDQDFGKARDWLQVLAEVDEQVVVEREDLEVRDDHGIPRVEDLQVLVRAGLQDQGRIRLRARRGRPRHQQRDEQCRNR